MIDRYSRPVLRALFSEQTKVDTWLEVELAACAAMEAVEALMTSGAQAVKLEGVDGHEEVVRHIVGSGVPVMGHIGLMPQHVHQAGGYRVQGRTALAADTLRHQARALDLSTRYPC